MTLTEDTFWNDVWFRCGMAGDPDPDDPGFAEQKVVGFPENQIADIYQTLDHDSLPPRTLLLVERIFQRFRTADVASADNLPTKREIAGAFRLLRTVYESRGHLLSALDRGRLLGAMGMLCRNHGEESSPQMRRFWQNAGIAALNEAVSLGDSIPAGLHRHLHWLTADTLIGAVRDNGAIRSTDDEKAILGHLIEACRGLVSDATRGLYFSCISRLFTLTEHSRILFCETLLPELRRAWTSLRAASLKNDFSALEAYRTLPYDGLKERLVDLLVWHVEDRFAVCTLLAWFEYRHALHDQSRIAQSKVYAFEAAALREHLNAARITRAAEPGVEIHSVRSLLRTAEEMRRVKISTLPNASVASVGCLEAMQCIGNGRVRAAVKVLLDESESADCSRLQRGLLRLKTAELWGDADDAAREREIIQRVLHVHHSDEHRDDAIIRAEAFRLWARNAANSECRDEVDALFLSAQQSAGAAAAPHVAFIVERYRVIQSLESGTPLSDLEFMGQLAWSSCLWNEPGWIEGSYGASLQGFGRRKEHAQRPDATGPRAFKRRVHDLGACPRNPDERRAYYKKILDLCDEAFTIELGELPGPWVSGLVNLYLGWVLGLPQHLRNEAFAAMDQSVTRLVSMVTHDLRPGRQDDHRERLAMVLCQWVMYRGTWNFLRLNPDRCKRLVFPAVESAISIARARIARMAKDVQKNPCRKRLRHIMATAAQTGLLSLLKGQLTSILNDCKTNNADPWYLEAAPEPDSTEFDDTAAISIGAAESDEVASCAGGSVRRQSRRAVLTYFLPRDYKTITNDAGAFAVLRKFYRHGGTDDERRAEPGDASEEVFVLSSAHDAIKTFRKTLKQAVKLYRELLPGAQPQDATENGNQEVSLPRLISDLKLPLTPMARLGNSDELNQKLDALEGLLTELGAALLPRELLESLTGVEHLDVVPDGRLFLLPLHALPIEERGNTLLDMGFSVSYKPRADYRPSATRDTNNETCVVLANTTDKGFNRGARYKAWTSSLGARNRWGVEMCADDRLRVIGEARRSVIVAHGHAYAGQELLSRIALKDGQCIAALDVATSRRDFRGSQIFLFSCHSMPQKASIARELLGLGGTLLSKGVACVAASIWECEVDDVAALAARICDAPFETEAVTKEWCDGLRAIGGECKSALQRFARIGCFMLYTGT
jgi:hypothetical protein